MISIKMLPARNGDALLIKFANGNHTGAILVDGGYAATFKENLHRELEILSKDKGRLDLVVGTHIDADHLTGLISFFRENGSAEHPKIIGVERVWHNSLRALTGNVGTSTPRDQADSEILNDVRGLGFPRPANAESSEISARQGSSLAALLLSHGYKWNGGQGIQPVHFGNSAISLGPASHITVIGPTLSQLDSLRDWWTSEMKRLGYIGKTDSGDTFDDAFEFLAARKDYQGRVQSGEISGGSDRSLGDAHFPDDSLINASSISFIFEHASRRCLFLADAWATDTLASLRSLHKETRILFDAIKVAHHGSRRNTSPELLELIDSRRYLISTDGSRHNHPDIEVLKEIVDRPSDFPRALYFNYPTEASNFMKSYRSASGVEFSVIEGSTEWIQITSAAQP